MSRSGARTLLILCALLSLTAPLGGVQLPDAFFGHFGASRTREKAIDWSISLGAMLLSEYGSSWDGPPNVWNAPQDYTNFDLLGTTVGYNYLSGGIQWDQPAGPGWLVFETAATLGITSDVATEWFQDGIHNFGRLPHVYRGRVDSGDALFGLELVGAYWRSWALSNNFDIDFFPTLGLIWSSYHREASAGIGVGVRAWMFKVQGSATKGWLYGSSSIRPALVAARLEPDYTRFEGFLTLERTKIGALSGVAPIPGVGVTWSSGIFPNEQETFISIFFDLPALIGNHSWRIEHVNDLINGTKDQGPTGGLRITYVAR